jgi:hypothetical protein
MTGGTRCGLHSKSTVASLPTLDLLIIFLKKCILSHKAIMVVIVYTSSYMFFGNGNEKKVT